VELLLAIQDGTDPTYITLVCKWRGMSGESIKIDLRAWGASEAGLANQIFDASIFNGAAGNAPISNALSAIGDQPFDVFAFGFNIATTQLDYIDSFLDGVSGRWSPSKQLYGHAICTRMDTYANLVAMGELRNGPHVSIMGVEGSQTPPWEWTGALAGLVTGHLAQPPEMSRPLQALQLKGVQPSPSMADWFSQEERQALLDAGISVHRVERDRTVWVDRVVTTYQTNVWGDPDASWRDIETMFQTSFFIRYLNQRIRSTYPRAALTDKPTGIKGFVSPGELYDLVVRVYYELQDVGLVENADLFARVLVVERDALEANRVNMLVPIDVVNQFRILAARVETNLQLRDASRLEV
jgi:phage tail sheath gpL-like